MTMTREEAIQELQAFANTMECPSLEAVDLAISALQELTDGDLISRAEAIERRKP